MPFESGKPRAPNAGRKKGTPNKKTAELLEVLAANNYNPSEELIYFGNQARRIFEYRKKKGNLSGALSALETAINVAEAIAQYVYPKKKSIEHSGDIGVRTVADFAKLADEDDNGGD